MKTTTGCDPLEERRTTGMTGILVEKVVAFGGIIRDLDRHFRLIFPW